MIPKVIAAKYEHDYMVHVLFSDGTEGDVRLRARQKYASRLLLVLTRCKITCQAKICQPSSFGTDEEERTGQTSFQCRAA